MGWDKLKYAFNWIFCYFLLLVILQQEESLLLVQILYGFYVTAYGFIIL